MYKIIKNLINQKVNNLTIKYPSLQIHLNNNYNNKWIKK